MDFFLDALFAASGRGSSSRSSSNTNNNNSSNGTDSSANATTSATSADQRHRSGTATPQEPRFGSQLTALLSAAAAAEDEANRRNALQINPPSMQSTNRSVVFISVPGRGIVGAAIAPDGQDSRIPFHLAGFGGSMMAMPFSDFGSRSGPFEALESSIAASIMMQAMMERIAQAVMIQSMEESRPTIPPANESIRDALPRVVVTKEDMLDSSNSKCAVCLEEFKAGCRATRMLCGHLFCTICIREWLREANTCPVCRYELETDQEEFEEGRKVRMSGRNVRLRAEELRMLRVPELRKLMKALGVTGDGCVEKADLILQLTSAKGVQVEPEFDDKLEKKRLRYELGELEELELPLLHNLMERHRVPFHTEKVDLSEAEERELALQSFRNEGWLRVSTPPANTSKAMMETPPCDEQEVESRPSSEDFLQAATPSSSSDKPKKPSRPSQAKPAVRRPVIRSTTSASSLPVEAPAASPSRPTERAPSQRRPQPGRVVRIRSDHSVSS